MKKISVIVAVYKAEKYIARCLNSLISQTLNDIEIILVDDGSPDKSGDICEEYAKKDERIIVFHQTNKGVSGARETGLKHATGEYVIHIDPDDWIDADMFRELYTLAKTYDYDMIFCDFLVEYGGENRRIVHTYPNSKFESKNMFRLALLGRIAISNCNKLVRRELFEKFNIHFPVGFNRWEDYYINCLILSHPLNIGYDEKPFYHVDRISNENSISRDNSIEEISCLQHYIAEFQKQMPSEAIAYLDDAKLMVKNCAFFRLDGKISSSEFKRIYPEVRLKFIRSHLSLRLHELGPCLAGLGLFKIGKYIYSKRRQHQ